MNIFIIGQCSLQWGRMEYGNIGNYYIIEPLIRELHRVFPNCKIKTTMQMSDRFCKEENVNSVPLQLYYNWNLKWPVQHDRFLFLQMYHIPDIRF